MVLGAVKIMRFCRKLITKGGISDIKNSHKSGDLVSNFFQKRGNKPQIFLFFILIESKPAKNNYNSKRFHAYKKYNPPSKIK